MQRNQKTNSRQRGYWDNRSPETTTSGNMTNSCVTDIRTGCCKAANHYANHNERKHNITKTTIVNILKNNNKTLLSKLIKTPCKYIQKLQKFFFFANIYHLFGSVVLLLNVACVFYLMLYFLRCFCVFLFVVAVLMLYLKWHRNFDTLLTNSKVKQAWYE